jgi:hypothetical protein
VSWYQETGTHVRTSSECIRRKRDQDFYAERGAHEGASKGEIAYTTDNERELAWRRKKKGERLLSDGEGEEKNSFSQLNSERPLFIHHKIRYHE